MASRQWRSPPRRPRLSVATPKAVVVWQLAAREAVPRVARPARVAQVAAALLQAAASTTSMTTSAAGLLEAAVQEVAGEAMRWRLQESLPWNAATGMSDALAQ